jgi:predicted nucleic acid-binding protein
MRLVLDSAVALKWVLPEVDSDKADRLRDDYLNGVHELLAPDVFPVEVAHALTRSERRGIVAVGQATILFAAVMSTSPQLHAYQPLLNRAIAISSAERVGVYDCLYVALAEREGCKLVTADARLVNSLGARFPFIVPLSSLP